jgi:hypothetical protein
MRKIMNTKSVYLALFVLLASILAACGAPAPAPDDPTELTQSFWDVLNTGNVDSATAFVSDDVRALGCPFVYAVNWSTFSIFMASETKKGVTFEVSDVKVVSDETVTYYQEAYDNGSLIASGLGKVHFNTDGKIFLIEFP